jgi:hypothetical protein
MLDRLYNTAEERAAVVQLVAHLRGDSLADLIHAAIVKPLGQHS